MTTPPNPSRLRELARTLKQASVDTGRALEAVDEVVAAITLYAGTRTAYPFDPAELPAGSVVAVGTDVYICRELHVGTPGYERFWTPAQLYALSVDDAALVASAARHPATVLRHGYDGADADRRVNL